ncbi:MAG: FAD-binding oxidoreductase, partial [Actinomycetota bacterium]
IAVVPLGGGTSVVGGLRAGRPHIALSLRRMNALVDLDTTSAIAHVEPGITGPRLEALLAARGFTLGHLPQSWQRASIGGYVATRSSGQASTGYGRSDDMVESLTVATPAGSLDLGRGPASAAGPDLRELFVGSEGSLGVITRVGLRVRRLPEERIYEGVLLPDFAAGREAFREAAQSRATADVMRLSDADETRTTLLMSAPGGVVGAALERYLRVRGIDADRASLAILGWEGVDRDTTRDRRSATWRVLKRHGAVSLGRRAGQSWRQHRFEGPFLRDALMDAGYLVETVETATSWSCLPALHDAVHAALTNALGPRPGPYVMSHVSHVYETGASLYTTVIAVADQSDPVGQWARAKRAVGDAIAAEGATITHHHAVGRDHAPWLEGEIGPLGIDVLRSVKDRVDPEGVMNPGNLLPE